MTFWLKTEVQILYVNRAKNNSSTGLLTYDFSSKKTEDVYYKILAVQGSSLLDLSHCLMYNISVY